MAESQKKTDETSQNPRKMGQSTAAPVLTGDGPSNTLILGCGYLGRRVAVAARSEGHQVYATTRTEGRADELATQGFHPLCVDWTDRRTMRELSDPNQPKFDRILVAVSYDRTSRLSRFESQVGGLDHLLKALEKRQGDHGHLCYISTTGVYHQTDGGWVDESSPAHARREGGRAHLDAESLLLRCRPKSSSTILRLAGIYGPGRVPRAADVIAGRPIRSPESGYLNLIHVDDAASVVMAAWDRAIRRAPIESLYVVADDRPVVRGEFYREIARQTGAPDPRFESSPSEASESVPTSPRASSQASSQASPRASIMRTGSNKRIWNRRMKRDLMPRLRYPTYREGLADVLSWQSLGR